MVKGEKRYFKDLAEFIKKAFDEKFQGTWHVIVGIVAAIMLRAALWCLRIIRVQMLHTLLDQLDWLHDL